MKEPDSKHWTDDSSSALGLDHASRDAGTLRRLSISPDNELGKGSLAKWDREERDRIEQGASEKREIEIEAILRKKDPETGLSMFTRKQAAEIVDREASKHGKEQKKLETDERRQRSIETLMDANKKVQGHGSSRSRRKTAKKGTWVCPQCHLEYCEHRVVKSKGKGTGRSDFVGARVSRKAKTALATSDVRPGEIIEAVVAVAISRGCNPGAIVAMLDSLVSGEKDAA